MSSWCQTRNWIWLFRFALCFFLENLWKNQKTWNWKDKSNWRFIRFQKEKLNKKKGKFGTEKQEKEIGRMSSPISVQEWGKRKYLFTGDLLPAKSLFGFQCANKGPIIDRLGTSWLPITVDSSLVPIEANWRTMGSMKRRRTVKHLENLLDSESFHLLLSLYSLLSPRGLGRAWQQCNARTTLGKSEQAPSLS